MTEVDDAVEELRRRFVGNEVVVIFERGDNASGQPPSVAAFSGELYEVASRTFPIFGVGPRGHEPPNVFFVNPDVVDGAGRTPARNGAGEGIAFRLGDVRMRVSLRS